VNWLRRWLARPDPVALFAANRSAILDAFLHTARLSGKPRGLTWAGVEPSAEPTFVRDSRQVLALWPVTVRFEVVPGSALEDVPHATEPRPIVAMFAFDGRKWRTDGKAVFNLSVDEVIRRSDGKFTQL
jgi:hypothetical protein